MNIFSIDLGNKRVKMKSERAEYSYPSSYLTTDFLSSDSLIVHDEIKENQIYQLNNDSNNAFVWGESLEIYNYPERMIDTYGRSNRMEQKKTKRLLEFALGRLALDYKESFSDDSYLKVNVILGLPISDMHKNSNTISILNDFLIGQHSLKINDDICNIEIPSEEYISIIPQYMGTVFNLAFDQNLSTVKKYIGKRIGVVDIGGGSVLINDVNSLNYSPTGTEKFLGIQELIKEIAKEINSTKLFLIEQLLREGNAQNKYFYKTNYDKKDISELVQNLIDKYTRFTIAPLITEAFPDLEEFDFIIMTGGGASILSKNALLDEIGSTYFERLVFCEEPERSNVRGFYRGASIKWKEDNSNTITVETVEKDILDDKDIISDQWGTSLVKFDLNTGVLTVFEGELDKEAFPHSIERSKVKKIIFEETVEFPMNSQALFGGEYYESTENSMISLTTLTGMDKVITKNVYDMSFMFNGCEALEVLDLSYFDISRVKNFSNMFANCKSLTELNLDSFDTSSVENFDSMFLQCVNLKTLNINHFDISSAITNTNMFEGCISLTNLTLPSSLSF